MPKNTADPIVNEDDIHAFETQLQALSDPIYYHLWIITTTQGYRVGDALTMKFDDINTQGYRTFQPQKQKEKKSESAVQKALDLLHAKAKRENWTDKKIEMEKHKIAKPLPTRRIRKRLPEPGRDIIRLRQQLRRKRQTYVFESPRKKGSPITRQAVWNNWKKAGNRAGLTVNIATHTGRKTAGVKIYKITRGDLARTANFLYQKDVQSVISYLGMTAEDADNLAEAIS